ncbi:MAG: HPr family phosphocarrier protein [Clostridia bacterium]|nr:HPr family phosphocarrier protein [Clostridia bacterium]
MKQFTYTIQDTVGIHARPAGLLAKKASEFSSKITLIKENKRADTRRIMMLMSLGIKCGDVVTVQVEGEDECFASEQIEKYLIENKF